MIIVANCKHRRPELNNPHHVYCGRPMSTMSGIPTSALGNPYRLDIDGDRDQCVQLFKKELWRAINDEPCLRLNGPAAKMELLRIARLAFPVVTLFCWCAPEPCHCDVIRAAIIWLNKNS